MEILRFKPVVKQTIWGGDKIARLKHLGTDATDIGETWEVSGLEGCETIVSGGEHDGLRLNDVVRKMKASLLGRDNYRRFGNEFPLLVKFIDAKTDLSIQVHPNDVTARRHGERRGKTEMWYVMEADAGASLYSGLKQWITPRQYKNMVADNTICDALALYEVKEGDVFYIPAGRIHSIRSGCMIAEIQQTCDLTYRIYDYNRRDKNGLLRQLHTRKASESIDYSVERDYRTHYVSRKNEAVDLVSCPYFTTALYDLDEPMTIDYSKLDSFVILVCLKGTGTVQIEEEPATRSMFAAGDVVLLPAAVKKISLSGRVRFLETYV